MEKKPKIVIILGPTAVGKTELALELATDFGGEIISADSMQVYRHLDIGTSKPTLDERERVPHHLVDIVDPDSPFNAALFNRLAEGIIRRSSRKEEHLRCRRHGALYPCPYRWNHQGAEP